MDYNLSAFYDEKVVVVTGGSGYIGSALINKLQKYNCKITRTSRTTLNPIDGVQDKILDLTSKESWVEIVSTADIIFHLAGNTSIAFAEENIDDSLLSNLLPIVNLVYASKKLKRSPRVVYASTATVYGMTDLHPVAEEVAPKPVSIYDLHKLHAEQHLTMASNQGFLNAKSLRLANVYGPSLSENGSKDRGILSRITQACMQGDTIKAYGGGDYLRDYIYIDDVVDAFLCACISDTADTVINVASGVGTTVKEVFQMISDEVEKNKGVCCNVKDTDWPENINIIEKRNFIASNNKLKSMPGWKVNVPLKIGVQRLVQYYS
jgi:nucleoside-diphosphate-sugar epimerase